MLRRVHDRYVNESGRYMCDQVLGDVDVNAKRDIWMRSPHHPDPFEEERLPQTDLASHGQHGTVTFGYGHLLPCSLPQLNESRRET